LSFTMTVCVVIFTQNDIDFHFILILRPLRPIVCTKNAIIRKLGPMLWFKKYFFKKWRKKLAVLARNKANLWKIWSQHWFRRKITFFFAEKLSKTQIIVIITSTPGEKRLTENVLFLRKNC
jgi:hypothetical protein